jgi:predicted ATP-grasp superfamily ATP-dependent carboligase
VYPVPAPERGVDAFLAAVASAVHASGAEVVLPSDDADMIALSWGRDRIPAVVPLAPHDVVLQLVDKLELVRAAQAAGLATPETRVADDHGFQEATYPVIVKPRFHWLPAHTTHAPARIAATICRDLGSAVACADRMRTFGATPLLQEFIDGTPVYVHLVSDRSGTVLALDQQESPERLFYPPGAGVRVRSVTVETDQMLASGITKLIGNSKWFGFVGISFVRDDDGVLRIIDFNGRIPASLEASAGAGPNYIAAWAGLAIDERIPALEPARVGTRFHWLEGDLGRAVRERRGGLARDVASSLWYSIGATHTVLKRDEPYAAIRQTIRLIRHRLRRILGR